MKSVVTNQTMDIKSVAKAVVNVVLFCVAMIAVIYFFGEPVEGEDYSTMMFFRDKLVSGAVLLGVIKLGMWLNDGGRE